MGESFQVILTAEDWSIVLEALCFSYLSGCDKSSLSFRSLHKEIVSQLLGESFANGRNFQIEESERKEF